MEQTIDDLEILCASSAIAITPDASHSLENKKDWYKNILFYHIWIPSFYDANNDGIGDICGIIEKLDYLASLGIRALWISPFFECEYKGENMHGYDVTDFYGVNKKLGTLEDIKKLLTEAHARNMRVVFDYPMNHTSDKHPWFIDSQNGGNYRDYYVWNREPGDGWHIIWDEARAKKTWHPHNGSNYYGVFHRSMPDLNYENIEVRSEMVKILTFWLNLGFDGVRVDGVRYIFEDGPEKISDTERTHTLFKLIHQEIFDKYTEAGYAKVLIAEAWGNKEIIGSYYGENNEFHMCFDFPLAGAIPKLINNEAGSEPFINDLIAYQQENYPEQYLGGIFLTNHDLAGNRPATDFNGDTCKMAFAMSLQLFLPGTPFIYYGNELGMKNVDAKWDMKVRSKMEWGKAAGSNCVFNSYQRIMRLYNELFFDFTDHAFTFYGAHKGIIAFTRTGSNEKYLFIGNYSRDTREIPLETFYKKGILSDLERKTVHMPEETLTLDPYVFRIFSCKKI